MRLALAQINPVVGDLAGNRSLILERLDDAKGAGADLVLFPELAVTGYPPEDLLLRPGFVRAAERSLEEIARSARGVVAVVGTPYFDRDLYNAAAVCAGGEVKAFVKKRFLPNYGVFDEFRYFAPGDGIVLFEHGETLIGVTVCEDMWQPGPPATDLALAGAELIVNISASPFHLLRDREREEMFRTRARDTASFVALCNTVGGQDELIFDGDSVVVSTHGEVLARGTQFEEELLVVDLDLAESTVDPAAGLPEGVQHVVLSDTPVPPYAALPAPLAPRLDPVGEVYRAVTLGLRDYVRKNGLRSVVLGLSGGIDSALVAAIACDALGPENVHAVSMPSDYSSAHSRDDAAELARRTGLRYRVQPIAPMVKAFIGELGLTGVAEENVQARCRGVILMGISNAEGPLTLATSNKSELAVGYSTLYGDSVGGFAPLKDVPKTLVWELARWRNAEAERRGEVPPIPESSITKPPSAELRPGQVDQDSLPEYAVLDAILDRYVEGAEGRAQLVEAGFDPVMVDKVVSLVDRAEWKRRQFAPGPKIYALAFGRDRRLPITSRWREQDS